MTCTDREAVAALLARVECASGPDREIDVAVLTTLGGWRQVDVNYFYGPNEWTAHIEAEDGRDELPAPTASIDAALALVERVLPGWFGSVDFGAREAPHYGAWLLGPKEIGEDEDGCPVDVRDEAHGSAPTPALATLSALLRALLQQDPT